MKSKTKYVYLIIHGLVLLACFIYTFYFIHEAVSISNLSDTNDVYRQQQNIVAVSIYSPEDSVDFFSGVAEVCDGKNLHVSYFTPDLNGYENNLLKWFSYAKYVDADGFIFYGFDESISFDECLSLNSKSIPFVFAGNNSIDRNNYEMVSTLKFDSSIISSLLFSSVMENFANDEMNLVAFGHGEKDSGNRKLLLSEFDNHNCEYTQVLLHDGNALYDEIRTNVMNCSRNNKVNAFLCLTEEDTFYVCRSIVDLNLTETVKVFGVGNSSRNIDYFRKGVLTSLVDYDLKDFGRKSAELLIKSANEKMSCDYVLSSFGIEE